MNKYLPTPVREIYRSERPYIINTPANLFQIIGTLIEDANETAESRRKVARDIINDTMSLKINIFEKLSLHFSKEAMIMERNRDNIMAIFDMFTFKRRIL